MWQWLLSDAETEAGSTLVCAVIVKLHISKNRGNNEEVKKPQNTSELKGERRSRKRKAINRSDSREEYIMTAVMEGKFSSVCPLSSVGMVVS